MCIDCLIFFTVLTNVNPQIIQIQKYFEAMCYMGVLITLSSDFPAVMMSMQKIMMFRPVSYFSASVYRLVDRRFLYTWPWMGGRQIFTHSHSGSSSSCDAHLYFNQFDKSHNDASQITFSTHKNKNKNKNFSVCFQTNFVGYENELTNIELYYSLWMYIWSVWNSAFQSSFNSSVWLSSYFN